MFRINLALSIAIGLLASLTLFADAKADKGQHIFDIDHGSGATEFEAIGRPGAIKIHGKGAVPRGTLSIDGLVVSGNITFDLESLDTGIKMRNEHMKKKYLETDKFPRATLTLNKVDLPKDFTLENCSISQASFEGVLKLHGVEKLIIGRSKIECKAGQVSLSANFDFAVSDFNIAIPSFAGVSMAKDVKVSVTVKAPTIIAVK